VNILRFFFLLSANPTIIICFFKFLAGSTAHGRRKEPQDTRGDTALASGI
jgi:hypothetical protein